MSPSIPSNLMIGNGLMNYDFNAGNGNPAYDLFVDKLDGLLSVPLQCIDCHIQAAKARLSWASKNKSLLFLIILLKVSVWSTWWPLRRPTATLRSLRSSRWELFNVHIRCLSGWCSCELDPFIRVKSVPFFVPGMLTVFILILQYPSDIPNNFSKEFSP